MKKAKETLEHSCENCKHEDKSETEFPCSCCIHNAIDKFEPKPIVADAVEVVRCKDCKFNVANMVADSLDSTDYSDITCSYFMTDGMKADDFCSRGKKMDGGDK